MNYTQVAGENERRSNLLAARIGRITAAVIIFIWILNLLGLFVVNSKAMALATYVTVALFLTPTLLVDILKNNLPLIKFIIMMCFVVAIDVLYSILTFHIILMFSFPIFVSILYFDKHLSLFATVTSAIGMIGAHIVSVFTYTNPEEPFTSFYTILIYGLLPRLFELFCIAAVVYCITERAATLLRDTIHYSDTLERNMTSLATIFDSSTKMLTARNYETILPVILSSMQSLLSNHISDEIEDFSKIDGYVGVTLDDKSTLIYDSNGEYKKGRITRGSIPYDAKNLTHRIPYNEDDWNEGSHIIVQEGCLVFVFYDNGRLLGFGILNVSFNRDKVLFDKLVDVLYSTIQIALKDIVLNKELFSTQEELICAFAEISESKSQQTGQHVKRVSEYTRAMAEAVGLERDECDNIALAAMMHDVGKLMIPSEILDKPGKLTNAEFDIIKQHTEYGFRLLEKSPGYIMQIAREICLQHHEKWDGTGYAKKKGEDIDYYSRIVAVADVFDALVSRRSYKSSWTAEDAYNEIVSQAGRQFDPAVIEVFKAVYPKFLDILSTYPDEEKAA